MKSIKTAIVLAAFAAITLAPARAMAYWPEIATGWHEIQNGASSTPATCTTAGMVPIFLGSPVALGCDAGLTYDAGTDTLTVGTVKGTAQLSQWEMFDAGFGSARTTLLFSAGGIPKMYLNASGTIGWSATPDPNPPDSGLRRVSAGLVGVTSGGSNLGGLQAGNLTAVALATPDAPTVTANGTNDAAASYSYKVVATLNDGTHTAAGAGTVFAGNTTLSGSNFNHLTVTPVPNAASYSWYRYASTGAPASVGLIVTTTVPYTNDTGITGDTTTAPTTNTTGRVLVGDGSVAAPSVAFASKPDSGLYNYAGVGVLGFSVLGNHVGSLGLNGLILEGMIAFGATGRSTLSSPAPNVTQVGYLSSATPVANTLIVGESGSGTNIAGANGVISSGIGTGSGAGSTLYLETPTNHGSDAVAQTQTARLRLSQYGVMVDAVPLIGPVTPDTIDLGLGTNTWRQAFVTRATLGSKNKALTDGSATAFATFTIADGATYTGEVIYNIKAVKGTALQALAGRVRFVATREGSTYTVAVNEVGTQLLAAAAGTLTGAVSIAGTAGVVTLSANFDTSQSSPDSFAMNYRFDSPDAALAITPL